MTLLLRVRMTALTDPRRNVRPAHRADPQQNGMVERVIRTLKEQCVHRKRFDSIQHATRAIGDWIIPACGEVHVFG